MFYFANGIFVLLICVGKMKVWYVAIPQFRSIIIYDKQLMYMLVALRQLPLRSN